MSKVDLRSKYIALFRKSLKIEEKERFIEKVYLEKKTNECRVLDPWEVESVDTMLDVCENALRKSRLHKLHDIIDNFESCLIEVISTVVAPCSTHSPWMNSIETHVHRNATLNLPHKFVASLQIELLDLKGLLFPSIDRAHALLRLKRSSSNVPLTKKHSNCAFT